ncbi:MAG: formylglycine-generating enzyme family protein [Alphaproteobacteria bacterium]|nr:formylglycine-generating enzyme family protein [Alphaproteobacteria bacterium]
MMRVPAYLPIVVALGLSACAQGGGAAAPLRDCVECPVLVIVPAGQFVMGSPADDPQREQDEGPARQVTIAKPLAMGKFEVTRAEFAAYVQATGVKLGEKCMVWTGDKIEIVDGKSWRDPLIVQGEDHPVVCVTWREAAAYAAWLAARTGLNYRLPSEAEWEYAARGGTQSPYAFPGGEESACAHGNIGDETAKPAVPKWRTAACTDGVGFGTAAVGSYRANAYGLHDMIGNVWEWMADCYRPDLTGAPHDGSAWGSGGECGTVVDRGGGFSSLIPGNLRPANRSRAPSPDNAAYSLGFRVVRDLTPAELSLRAP